MKLIIQDRKGKQMVFQTLFEVEELGKNYKTFICDEWILTDVEYWSGWLGKPEEVKGNSTQLNCTQCGSPKDVKFSPYDFSPYCEEHRPVIGEDKVTKTEPNLRKY